MALSLAASLAMYNIQGVPIDKVLKLYVNKAEYDRAITDKIVHKYQEHVPLKI